MKAARFYKPDAPLKVEQVPEPKAGPNEVLVNIKACGICRGDVQRHHGQIKVPLSPMILGHEPAGIIAEIGSDVDTELKAGDPVAVVAVGCGQCYYCRTGRDNLCDAIPLGLGIARDGCYAEYAVASPRQLFKIPDNVPLEAGAIMAGPTGTAFHAINMAEAILGDTVVLFGAGCLGTQALQLLKMKGITTIMVDIADGKLEIARQFGADHVINSRRENPVAKVKELTDGYGAYAAIEFIGLPQTLLQAIDCLRKGGRVIDVGSVTEPFEISLAPFTDRGLALTKEVSLMTITHFKISEAQTLMRILAAGKLDFETGTAHVALDEINRGLQIKETSQEYFRVLVHP
ncbi:MAG: alcohol dehydrogenase catalytic domain-containing protein [Planctomycetes bacterium]|nr:alcohol dehydrogenase catalytic domain-containing protein [Planctomycetota bacterium]